MILILLLLHLFAWKLLFGYFRWTHSEVTVAAVTAGWHNVVVSDSEVLWVFFWDCKDMATFRHRGSMMQVIISPASSIQAKMLCLVLLYIIIYMYNLLDNVKDKIVSLHIDCNPFFFCNLLYIISFLCVSSTLRGLLLL